MKTRLIVDYNPQSGFGISIDGVGLIQTFPLDREQEMCYWVICYASNSNMIVDFEGWQHVKLD